MSTQPLTPQIDFSKYEAQAPAPQIDFSKYAGGGSASNPPSDRIADSLQNATISPPESGITAMLDRAYNRVRDFIGADHKPAGDVLGGAALGPIRTIKGVTQLPDHPVRAVNNIVGGAGQTVALPAAVINPGTMAYAAPAIAAQTGVQEGLKEVGVDPDYAEFAGNVAGIGAGVGTGAAMKPRTPRSVLSKTIKPADPVEFHAAEQSAIPKINAAAQELGQPIKTASDAIAAIRQAKQNALLGAHEAAGTGKTIADLPADQVDVLQKDMADFDTLKAHIEDAQAKAATKAPKPEPTAGGVTADFVGTVSPRAAHAINLAGKVSNVYSLLKGKNALTPASLDSSIESTFGAVEPAPSKTINITTAAEKPPYEPAQGDLAVKHESNIKPPETPHGDATISPDQKNPAFVASGSTLNPPTPRPRAVGPNVKPAASTTQLDSTLASQVPPAMPESVPVKQPLKASTPAAQTAEVLKKAGVQQALKDAGVAAPSATVRQIRPGIEVGPTLTPRMDLTFYGDKTGEGASLMQLTRYNINELRAMAVQRGLDVSPAETHVQLIDKIHDDLSPEEIKEFSDAAAERGRFSPPARAKRGAQPKSSAQPEAGTEEPSPIMKSLQSSSGERVLGDAGNFIPESLKQKFSDVAHVQINVNPNLDNLGVTNIRTLTPGQVAAGVPKVSIELHPLASDEVFYHELVHAQRALKGRSFDNKTAEPSAIKGGKFFAEKIGGETEAPPERRTNIDLRQAVDSMSPEDQVKAIYQDDITGAPNRRAFEWAEQNYGPAKSVAMTDADGLKAFNDKYGHEAGDAMLQAKTKALKEAGLEFYRGGKTGDEFLARGTSDADLGEKLEKAREILQNSVIRVKDAQGNSHDFIGADFSHGSGADLKTAEQNMYKMKQTRKASGDAPERGQFGKIKEIKK